MHLIIVTLQKIHLKSSSRPFTGDARFRKKDHKPGCWDLFASLTFHHCCRYKARSLCADIKVGFMAPRWHCSPRSPFPGWWRDKCGRKLFPPRETLWWRRERGGKKVIETKIKQESGCRISKVPHWDSLSWPQIQGERLCKWGTYRSRLHVFIRFFITPYLLGEVPNFLGFLRKYPLSLRPGSTQCKLVAVNSVHLMD